MNLDSMLACRRRRALARKLGVSLHPKKKAAKKHTKKHTKKKAAKKHTKRTSPKAHFLASQRAKGRTEAQALAAWKLSHSQRRR